MANCKVKMYDGSKWVEAVNSMANFILSIGSTNGGNPRQVLFATVNYSTYDSNKGTNFKLSATGAHGNGSAYAFLEDIIISVNYQGTVTCNVYKYVQTSVTLDSVNRAYGDVFYTIDTTNKIVSFYILLGQYSSAQFTPFTKIGSSTKDGISQKTGSPSYYSSGTKVWANGITTLYATQSWVQSLGYATQSWVQSQGYVTASSIPQHQAYTCVVANATTNLNGYSTGYSATDTTIGGYTVKIIKNGSSKLTYSQAQSYMNIMTGSDFVPEYNQTRPCNTLFIFGSDNSIWKPQYDSTNGLVLYYVNTLVMKSSLSYSNGSLTITV